MTEIRTRFAVAGAETPLAAMVDAMDGCYRDALKPAGQTQASVRALAGG